MPLSVNKVEISDREINIESAFQEGSIEQRQNRAAVALAVREVLLQRARELEPDNAQSAEQDDDALIEALLAREVRIPERDESACRRYYEANPERFRSPSVAAVRHILLAAAPDDIETRDAARQRAEALIAELRDAPGKFAVLARAHSACPSREQGGALGPISRGQTVAEFETVVLRLPVGLAQRALETRYGYHVVWIDERREGEPLPYAAVSERIAQYLHEQAWRRAVSQYIRLLAECQEVEGIDLEAAQAP